MVALQPEQMDLFGPALAASVRLQVTVILPLPPGTSCEVSHTNPVGRAGKLTLLNVPEVIVPLISWKELPAIGVPPMLTTVRLPPRVTVPPVMRTWSVVGVAPALISILVAPARVRPLPKVRVAMAESTVESVPPALTAAGPPMVPVPPSVPPVTVTVLPAASDQGLFTS